MTTDGTSLIVVKSGGTAGVDPAVVCAAVARAVAGGCRVVLVHGGSAEAAALAARLDIPLRRMVAPDGSTSRHTDDGAMEALTLAWSGRVKPALVTALIREGVPCAGITGLDGGLLQARRNGAQRAVVGGRTVVVRDDRSGRIASVRPGILRVLLDEGLVPVVSPPALASDGTVVNVDADRIAAAVAVALGATRLVLLTAAPGVLADRHDAGTVLATYRPPPDGRDPAIAGGMAVKLAAAQAALAGGVGDVVVADGRDRDSAARALAGTGGTRILPTTARKP
ncbi:acetylglutamate kinase [Actinophytocola oryzae]|uniref:Acetylglutamate/LysW-gamma-L-alpha-aminoadipate kinase n=1 Tax=Actinophytocola oryzae TaxID=502181 RepID=A0A4R7V6M2_9PSEU|nr:acetylglutamate kinase [Actinophytocola oryzae]TDV43196.1 acetylglutamate/LysW-gamma-L-alpha-aminoadipate kinase [Actinophytocola oryzae]